MPGETEEGRELLECDLIMKGGVASGVVYPSAIRRLAQHYRFRGVGGTSAGAIAAAAAAAAEYGRQVGKRADAFDALEALDKQLATKGFIRSLFQPQKGCIPVYWAVTEGIQGKNPVDMIVRGLGGLVAGYARALRKGSPGLGIGHVWSPKSSFGLCTGMPTSLDRKASEDKEVALTGWLHRWYQRLSGFEDGRPLTFTDLEEANVRLRMVTTNVSREHPITLPFPFAPRSSGEFLASVSTPPMAFKQEEFERLFPKEVVDHLVAFSSGLQADARFTLPSGYYWLPLGNALPVIVAVRLSLSFPLLLTAVRLFSIPQAAYIEPRLEKPGAQLLETDLVASWFSDGGITNNLPMQFFDTWVPTRPTFVLNLTDRPQDGKTGSTLPDDQVWRPGPLQHVEFPVRAVNNAFRLLYGIAVTAQSAHDELQRNMPGYRERVVHVFLSREEGGFNLDMTTKVIEGMQKKGDLAGKRALAFGEKDRQDLHRWLRLLAIVGHLDIQGWRLARALEELRTHDHVPLGNRRPNDGPVNASDLLATLKQIAEVGRTEVSKEEDRLVQSGAAVAAQLRYTYATPGNKCVPEEDLMLESLAAFVAAHYQFRLAEQMYRPPGAMRIVPEV